MRPKFDERVAVVKTYPGITGDMIDWCVEREYRGIILDGTGLGHVPQHIHQSVRGAIEEGLIVAVSSQCIWGRVNMNVYRPGIEMLEMGVVSCENMLTETAAVKLMWLLANTRSTDKARTGMSECIVGEFDMRTEQSEYHPSVEAKRDG